MHKRFLLFFALMSGHAGCVLAQTSESFKVQVTVSAEGYLKEELESYITRELRSLNDVTVVDSSPAFVLRLVAMADQNKAGRSIGYTIAYLFLTKAKANLMTYFDQTKYPKDTLTFIADLFGEKEIVEGFGVLGGSPEDLRSLCRDLVTKFDIGALKSYRDALRKVRNP